MFDNIKILFIDDDEEDFIIIRDHLNDTRRIKFQIEHADSFEKGLNLLKENRFDVYLLDYRLGNEDGLKLLKEAEKFKIEKPIIVITGEKNGDVDIASLKLGAIDYLVKSEITANILERSIIYAIERKKLEKKLKEEKELKNMIFKTTSAAICLVDLKTNLFIEINESFSNLFKKSEKDTTFNGFLKIKKYSNPIFNNNLEDHVCQGLENCPCIVHPFQVRVITKDGLTVDCLMSCKSIQFENGKTKSYRLITLIDITKQKKIEELLIESQKKLNSLVREYGLVSKNPAPLLSLVELQLDQMDKVEDLQ